MHRPTVLACAAAIALVGSAAAADQRYFGLEVPRRPEVFEPALIAAIRPLAATNPAFSGDFRRFVFTAVDASTPAKVAIRLYEARFDGKRWSDARPLQLLADRAANSAEPAFSPDGQWLYFTSNGLPGAPFADTRAYRARVTGDGYATAERVPIDIPSTQRVFYPQPLADGSLLLTSRIANSSTRDDVFMATRAGEGFATPVALPGDFNSAADEWDVIEHPQGNLRLWVSGRPGGAGRTDIYFARKNERGEWSPAQSLAAINTALLETAPRLSPDGRVLFFQRVEEQRERLYWVGLQSILP
jgi:hypothetical protein